MINYAPQQSVKYDQETHKVMDNYLTLPVMTEKLCYICVLKEDSKSSREEGPSTEKNLS